MEPIIIPLVVVAIVGLIVVFACWISHLEMTRSDRYPCGWGNYRTFKREFYKKEWKANIAWKSSLFNKDEDLYGHDHNYLHAGIFKFDGKGMMMRTPWDYILANLLIRKEAKKQLVAQKVKVDWHLS
jgi:hypothetical protein